MKLPKSVLLFLFFGLLTTRAWAQAKPAPAAGLPDKLSATEFARIITEFSEPGGDFLSDNLISNETAYLPVLSKLKELNATGGAYIGVGPEQNFTYIAKIRPRIAFIIDIRHLAVMHHLLYKAIFHLSPDRTQFLARLLSRPVGKEKAPAANASVGELLDYFTRTPKDEKFYAANLAEIRKTIETEFQIKVSTTDQAELEHVMQSFKLDGLEIAFRFGGGWNTFPSLKDIIAQTDVSGKSGHFLASVEDYEFLRQMQMKNLIIPVNGDFGGKKALATIGDYLRKNNVTVTAFYLSNVEQYLFGDYTFEAFVRNVKALPTNEQSLFIRSVLDRYDHPARMSGHMFTMLLQRIPVFVKDFDEGRYRDYYQLVSTHYISVGQ
ncbi:MAG: hypothetical protein JST84_08630 [Acidobacteria bacterium]|nr:hypothetical protein [Acidobacteriota bacterium]